MQLAPIILFAYKRPLELSKTIKALKANFLASQSELFVFVDGPKNATDLTRVKSVRQLVDNIDGFQNVHRFYSEHNMGLANSIINGVSQVMKQHGCAIVLEDDLCTSRNFLDYMNQALSQYKHQAQVFSITGYTFPFKKPQSYTYDGYFYPRTGSWGWATWADRWQTVDWNVSDYEEFLADEERCNAFNYYGNDRLKMLRRWKTGAIDSWAIRFCYAQVKVKGLTLYPTLSKVDNIGFSNESTNTHGYNRYKTILDLTASRQFDLPTSLSLFTYYNHKFRRKFSLPVRMINRILTNVVLLQRWLTKKRI